MFKFLSKWKDVLGLSWQWQSTVASQREGERTGETLRFTQSQKTPFSHTVFSVTVHGMDDLKTPHHFVPPLFAAPFPCVFFLCSCIPARITGTVVINAESMAVPEILLGI